MTECKRCICDSEFPGIVFDDSGICNYCHKHDELDRKYPIDDVEVDRIAERIKKSGAGKPFDAIVGVSGGKDSSYLLHLANELGIRVLAVHYDNGWDTAIAKKNIEIMTSALQTSLLNYRVRQEEVDDLILSFLLSHTQDAESPTDLGLVKCMFDAAVHYDVKYILDGHCFRTEGFAPIEWSYMDGRYIKNVHNMQKNPISLKTYPMLTLMDQIKYGIKGIKRERLLYHVDYNSTSIKEFLESRYGWEWYGGHHLENVYTSFFGSYYRPNKLGYNGRIVELSALVRSGQITREQAIERMDEPQLSIEDESKIINEVKARLKIPDVLFDHIMDTSSKKTCRDYKTYRNHFKLMMPVFWLMMKTKRIPDSFYFKYCKG